MAIWRKPLQFINVTLANRSPMNVAERGPGRMTYAKKNKTLCRTRPARHASVRIWYFVSNRGGGGGGSELRNASYRNRADHDLGHRDVTRI